MVCPIKFIEERNNSKVLAFSCDLCTFQEPKKGDIAASPHCRQQFFQVISFIDSNYPCKFYTNNQIISLTAESMKILKEYIRVLTKFEPSVQNIFRKYPDIRQKFYSNPYEAYKLLQTASKSKKHRSIEKFISALSQTPLISQAKVQLEEPETSNPSNIYERTLKIRKLTVTHPRDPEDPYQLLNSYDVGPFNIQISENSRYSLENYYQAFVSLDETLAPQMAQHLFSKQYCLSSKDSRLQTLDELLTQKITDFQHYLVTHFSELTKSEQTKFAVYATAQSLNLTKTMPLLLDDEVQEIYLDKPGCAYYLDHAKWGRCKSNLVPSPSELSHLITRLRLESRRPLDERNPSLKTELKTHLFHVRAAIDIPPLAYEGPHLNIRKIRMRTLTLPELIHNRTISLSAAAFLILCMTMRINITINGEPSTGKTTLANAINLLAPPSWRRIAIEDALESVTVDEGGRHKVTFRVDPFDSIEKSQSTKSNEIIRLLHRSPDWVFLGEIQTAEHSAAMFHAISAGIRGIQTCHANSNNELLLRWKVHHNIPEVCFQSLGLLIHMVREVINGQIRRKVAQISEGKTDTGNFSLKPLFEWNKSSGQLEQRVSDLFSSLILRTCKFQQVTKKDIKLRFKLYKETLTLLVKNKIYDPDVIVSAFDTAHAKTPSIKSEFCETSDRKEAKGGERIKLCELSS